MRRHRPDHEILQHLRRLDPDGRWTAHVLDHLRRHSDVVDVAAGSVIATAGRRASQVVVVLGGELEADEGGGCACTLTVGATVGLDEVRTDRTHRATVSARTGARLLVVFGPAVRAARLPRAEAPPLRRPSLAAA